MTCDFQVMVQKQNRDMSMSVYIASLAVTDSFALVVGKLKTGCTLEFFTIDKSDRSVRSDRNEMQFLRIITI